MRLLFSALAFAALGTASLAAPVGQWRPSSTTSVSITGPVTLWSDRIAMTGATLKLREVAQPASFKTDDGDRPAHVFAVVKPRKGLKLLNGNTLCGETSVTWIVAQPRPPHGLQLLTFDGPDRPTGQETPGLCGIFFYTR